MHTVVETPAYLKAAESIFSEAEQREIVLMVSSDAHAGDVMPGTGGFRKIRVGRGGMGKRGGARVIYIVHNESLPIFLIMAFAKKK